MYMCIDQLHIYHIQAHIAYATHIQAQIFYTLYTPTSSSSPRFKRKQGRNRHAEFGHAPL